MSDRDAAILFASALHATLDSHGHMTYCMGHAESYPCDYPPCARAREAVALAIRAGYLPVPGTDVEAAIHSLRAAQVETF